MVRVSRSGPRRLATQLPGARLTPTQRAQVRRRLNPQPALLDAEGNPNARHRARRQAPRRRRPQVPKPPISEEEKALNKSIRKAEEVIQPGLRDALYNPRQGDQTTDLTEGAKKQFIEYLKSLGYTYDTALDEDIAVGTRADWGEGRYTTPNLLLMAYGYRPPRKNASQASLQKYAELLHVLEDPAMTREEKLRFIGSQPDVYMQSVDTEVYNTRRRRAKRSSAPRRSVRIARQVQTRTGGGFQPHIMVHPTTKEWEHCATPRKHHIMSGLGFVHGDQAGRGFFQNIGHWFQKAGNTVKDGVVKLADSAKDTVVKAADGIYDGAMHIFDKGTDLAKTGIKQTGKVANTAVGKDGAITTAVGKDGALTTAVGKDGALTQMAKAENPEAAVAAGGSFLGLHDGHVTLNHKTLW